MKRRARSLRVASTWGEIGIDGGSIRGRVFMVRFLRLPSIASVAAAFFCFRVEVLLDDRRAMWADAYMAQRPATPGATVFMRLVHLDARNVSNSDLDTNTQRPLRWNGRPCLKKFLSVPGLRSTACLARPILKYPKPVPFGIVAVAIVFIRNVILRYESITHTRHHCPLTAATSKRIYTLRMPRQPKFIHPVRHLRNTIAEAHGHMISQPAFAALVGTSPATIQSVELGRMKLSPALARRIAVLFGADARSLMKKTGKPKSWRGQVISSGWVRNSRIPDMPKHQQERFCGILLTATEAVLVAANAPNKKRFEPVMTSLRQWIAMAVKEFALEGEWRKALATLEAQGRAAAANLSEWKKALAGLEAQGRASAANIEQWKQALATLEGQGRASAENMEPWILA